jgi:hypothetical protein
VATQGATLPGTTALEIKMAATYSKKGHLNGKYITYMIMIIIES